MTININKKIGTTIFRCVLTATGIASFLTVSFGFQTHAAAEKLRTQFTGQNKCLDIVNDANDNKLIMADCGNYSGQFWQISATGNGYYRLRTQFTGQNKCLDIVNDANDNKLIMANCGNYSGQFWQFN